MKRLLSIFVVIILAGLIPQMVYGLLKMTEKPDVGILNPIKPLEQDENPLVCVLSDSMLMEISLDEYIMGVVLGEMPASFHEEALKAQAIAARTYTLKRIGNGTKHDSAHVCTMSSCCQAYVTKEDYLVQGGYKEDIDKVQSAVVETSDLVVTYNGELIEATYYSSSGGKT